MDAADPAQPPQTDRDRLAALLHDAMPDETNWRTYFRREDEADGWSLVLTRKLSEHLADRLLAAGVIHWNQFGDC